MHNGYASADIFTRTVMQDICDPHYRGRVVSVGMVFSHLVSLIVIPAGVLADAYGVALVVGSMAGLVLVVHLAVGVLAPQIRQVD